LTNSLCVTSPDCQGNADSDVDSSVPFGEKDDIQTEALQISPAQVFGGTETDPSRYIKTSLGSIGFSPAPGLEISSNPGRSLVLFFESTRTNLASRPGGPANNSTTNDQQSENNVDSGVEFTWIPLGISSAERTEVDQPIPY
jgi:hypothetical protein